MTNFADAERKIGSFVVFFFFNPVTILLAGFWAFFHGLYLVGKLWMHIRGISLSEQSAASSFWPAEVWSYGFVIAFVVAIFAGSIAFGIDGMKCHGKTKQEAKLKKE